MSKNEIIREPVPILYSTVKNVKVVIKLELLNKLPRKKKIANGVEAIEDHYRIYGFNQCLAKCLEVINEVLND